LVPPSPPCRTLEAAPQKVDPHGGGDPALGLGLALVVAAICVAWWTLTDRLDLPKQMVLVLGSAALAAWALLARRPLAVTWPAILLIGAPVLGLTVAWSEMTARVEGWVGWLAAATVFLVARSAAVAPLARALTALSLSLALVAWLQALGAPLFNAQLTGFFGRRVVGTLGGPNHLGWTLALLLPWSGTVLLAWAGLGRAAATPRRDGHVLRLVGASLGLVAILGGIVLSGSRVAWVMAGATLPFWIRPPAFRWRLLVLPGLAILLAALVSAVVVDRVTRRARLGSRAADLVSRTGSARGRLYLWQVHLSSLPRSLCLGAGPEGFVRRWPDQQRRYLDNHPEQARYRSDLRHAHADVVEVLWDLGIFGVGLGAWLVWLAWRRKPPGDRWRGASAACLVAAVIGGLAAPLVFFPPTQALAAIALGVRLGPPAPASRARIAPVVVALLIATALLSVRLVSEVQRSRATRARGAGNAPEALVRARQAARTDRRNPRAWLEITLACEKLQRWRCALAACERAHRDLPTDGVAWKLRRLHAKVKR